LEQHDIKNNSTSLKSLFIVHPLPSNKVCRFVAVLTLFILMHKCSPVIYSHKRRSILQNKGSALLWHKTYIFISSAVPMDKCGMCWWSSSGKRKWA